MSRQRRYAPRRGLWVAAAVAGLLIPMAMATTAAAQTEAASTTVAVERPSSPDIGAILTALGADFAEYKTCTDEVKAPTLEEMWTRQAPLGAAIYDISNKYRTCEGFIDFWSVLYFAGFDSPEQWIDLELRAIKLAAMQRAETSVDVMRASRQRLRDASLKIGDDRRMKDDDKRVAKKNLADMMYVLDALRPEPEDAELFEPYIEEQREGLLAFLPEDAEERLATALEFAAVDDADAERVMKRVKRDIR